MTTLTLKEPFRTSFLKQEAAEAWEYFQETGYPNAKNENWRFSNPEKWLQDTEVLAPLAGEFPIADFSPWLIPDTFSILIYNDCIFVPEKYPANITVSTIQDVLEERSFKKRFGNIVDHNQQPLAAENSACFPQGLYIKIADNAVLEQPLHIIHLLGNNENSRVFPRILIHTGSGANADILESEINTDSSRQFVNSVYEIFMEDNANLKWTKLQQLNVQSGQAVSFNAVMKRDASMQFNCFDFGAGFNRNEIHAYLRGPGADLEINNLFVPNETQHMDTSSFVHHEQPHGSSRQLIKGVLGGKSTGVFRGLANVYRDAEKTDSRQTNHNLLLSDSAKMNSIPQLEIYEDDVKCSHGSTTGQLNENAIFYLRSRGISRLDAAGLLVKGFANEVVNRVTHKFMQEKIQAALLEKLEGMVK